MYQALHRDLDVKAWCIICISDTQKFEEANSSENKGLAIHTREGVSQHWGAKLFLRGAYAVHELGTLAERHPDDIDLRNLMLRLRTGCSAKERDEKRMGDLTSYANLAWRISEEGVGEWTAGIRRTIDTYRSLNAGHSPPAWKWSPAHRGNPFSSLEINVSSLALRHHSSWFIR